MILVSQDKHLRVDGEGRLFWQPDPTNPLPGAEAGRVVRGEALLAPAIDAAPGGIPAETLTTALTEALRLALAPLFALTEGEGHTDASRAVAEKLQQALGILPREDIEDIIATLDEEGRKALRARKVRMGPLLVFLPDLNKPAAVKQRALLLSLWNGGPLPASIPPDGMVSLPVEGKEIDPAFYRAVGYPVYGPRAIRVDMLDRVVCAVYDSSKDGKFQAQHKMAEWLGSNIPDLYAVLEAMGHTKIHDPLEEKIKEADAQIAEAVKAEDASDASEPAAAEAAPPAGPAEKPELATFRLKRGKAAGQAPAPKARSPKTEFRKKPERAEGDKDRPKGKRKPDPKREGKKYDDRERVYTAKPKTQEESPFAILQGLKTGSKE